MSDPHVPRRTCIGCRKRAAAAEMLRVVVAPAPAGTQNGSVQAVPDPRRRASGRGAWLHLDPRCVALAERRRSFGRALRAPVTIDPAPVRDYVAQHSAA
ncbi:MAG TPA: YlxR family protein [Jatrophihabitantaceae bacterium]